MEKKKLAKQYKFLAILIAAMILGMVLGAVAPDIAKIIDPLGQIFINMMFCIVVPLVFFSISGSIAGMQSKKRAGKILGTTILTFVITGAICAVIMFFLMKICPPVLEAWTNVEAEKVGEHATMAEMVVNFFTATDFSGLLSRKALLPLIVFSLIMGFATNAVEHGEGAFTSFLKSGTNVMLKFVNIITYYAPVAFLAIFANLIANYGPQLVAGSYGRAIALYYPLCFAYLVVAFPLYALFGGGKGAAKVMWRHIARPAVVSLGTCSSAATIPTNMDVTEETGISKDVAEMVIPLGATMHMDGSCFSCVMKIFFVCGVLGNEITLSQLPFIVLIAVLSSVGMSGVPGGGYIGEYIICCIFFPNAMELAFPILVAIGNFVDPPATMINAAGDYVVCFIVSKFVDGKDWLQKKLATGEVR